jgi:hypothetical protein
MAEQYPIKFESAKTSVYISIILSLVSLLAILSGQSIFFILFVIFLSFAARSFRRYRGIWLYEDKLQVVDFMSNYFYELYYDEIAHAGFLDTQYLGSRRGFVDGVYAANLVILDKARKRIELPAIGQDSLHQVLQFILPRIDKSIPSHVPQPMVEPSTDDLKFESPKTSIIWASAALVCLVVVIGYFVNLRLYGVAGFFVMALLALVIVLRGFVTQYKCIEIESNKLVFKTITNKTEREIYYSEIKQIGFLHTGWRDADTLNDQGNPMQDEELIILLKDSSRLVLDDISNLHELCAYVQQRIRQH